MGRDVGAFREPPPTPPLREAKGTRSAATQGMPELHRNTTYPTTTVPPREPHVIPADAGIQRKTKHAGNRPLSREPSPSPSQGETKRGSQGEGNRAAMGCGSTQTTNLFFTENTLNNPTPSFPSFPIIRIIVQVFPKVPQFQNAPFSASFPHFPTQHLTRTIRPY